MNFKKFFFIFWFTQMLVAQTNEFYEPWKDSSKAIVIDLYGGNEIDWVAIKNDPQLSAIIHKASQGLKEDSKYRERRKMALRRGYKWGSYHLGTNDDPVKQADHYLNIVGDNPSELLALDLESDDSTKHMNLRNALIFIGRIYQQVGRYPLVYCNKNMMKLIMTDKANIDIWSNCGLWIARFRKDIPDFERDVWNTYTLWQFSCEINCKKTGECLYNVPGTLYDIDVNIYNGSKAELLSKWPFN